MAARHQLSRHDREQHYQRLTLIGTGVIVLIVATLLGAGWFQSYVRPYHQTVVTVGSMRADMTYFIKVLKQVLPGFANSDPQVVVSAAPDTAQAQIEQLFILLQRAPAAGISATVQEVDEALGQDLGVVSVNGSPPDRIALEAGLRSKLGTTGLTLAEYRETVRAKVLRDKLQAKLGADYPRTGAAVKYEAMILNRQDDAKSLLTRFSNGDAWDAVTADVRKDSGLGGVVAFDFQPKVQLDDKLADPLFALNPGQHTDVIQTTDGRYAIGLLVEKDNQHAFTDDGINAITPKLLVNWIEDQKKSIQIKENLSDDQKLFAIAHSDWQPPAKSSGPAQPSTAPPAAAPGVPAQVPGLQNIPPGIATPSGGLVAPTIPALPATPSR